MVMSFLYYSYRGTQPNGVIHGEKSTGARSDGMIESTPLFLYYILMFWLVSQFEDERIEFPNLPKLPHSLALV